jgi:hypothetical protein
MVEILKFTLLPHFVNDARPIVDEVGLSFLWKKILLNFTPEAMVLL